MLSRSIRSLSVLACVAVALTGCLKVRQRTVVMPDGSGKVTMTVGFSKAITSMAKGALGDKSAKDPFAELNDVPKNCEGFVAFTRPEKTEKDGFTLVTFTGYFEDANKVRFGKPKMAGMEKDDPKANASALTLQFKKEGDGFTLAVDNGMMGDGDKLGDLNKDDPDMPPETKEMMKKMVMPMVEGLEISESYEVPGAITTADGLAAKEGRVASTTLTAADIFDEKKSKELAAVKTTKRRIVCGPSQISDDDVKAFRAEMAKAKDEFVKWQAELAAKKTSPEKPETEPAPATPPAGK